MEERILQLENRINELTNIISKNSFSNLEVFDGPVRVSAPISVQAGGKIGLYIGSGPFGIYYGSGAPTISASKGSFYLRSDGTTTTSRAYINMNGGTTWTALTTVA